MLTLAKTGSTAQFLVEVFVNIAHAAVNHGTDVGLCGRSDPASRRGPVDRSCAKRIVIGLMTRMAAM
jgi:hypothetical protein